MTAEGEALVTDSERAKSPVEFVQRLLDMREKYDIIVREAFHSDKGFNRALKNVRAGAAPMGGSCGGAAADNRVSCYPVGTPWLCAVV